MIHNERHYDGKLKRKFYSCFDLFSEVMVADHDICDHDLRKEIKMLAKPFDMKHLAILQVTASKAVIKE